MRLSYYVRACAKPQGTLSVKPSLWGVAGVKTQIQFHKKPTLEWSVCNDFYYGVGLDSTATFHYKIKDGVYLCILPMYSNAAAPTECRQRDLHWSRGTKRREAAMSGAALIGYPALLARFTLRCNGNSSASHHLGDSVSLLLFFAALIGCVRSHSSDRL